MKDPKLMWQSMDSEYPVTPVEVIRLKAQEVQSRTRRNLIIVFVLAALVLTLGVSVIGVFSAAPIRLTAAAIMGLTLIGAYAARRRMWRRHTLSPDIALKGCIEFYRKELERQYRSLQLTWGLLLPVLIFGFLTVDIPVPIRTTPSFPKIVMTVLLLLILFERRREARRINRKLAGLDAFEKKNAQ